MCHEKATLKGEFSNKPLTETLDLRAELPCRGFKRDLLLRSLSVVCNLWIVPALAAQSNHSCHRLSQPAGGHPSTTWWRGDCPYLRLFAHSASSWITQELTYLLQAELTGYEGKGLSHRLDQGALMGSLLPAELWSQLVFSTNRYRIIFPQPLLIGILLFPW